MICCYAQKRREREKKWLQHCLAQWGEAAWQNGTDYHAVRGSAFLPTNWCCISSPGQRTGRGYLSSTYSNMSFGVKPDGRGVSHRGKDFDLYYHMIVKHLIRGHTLECKLYPLTLTHYYLLKKEKNQFGLRSVTSQHLPHSLWPFLFSFRTELCMYVHLWSLFLG